MMKNSFFIVAVLALLSMTACTANESDPMEQADTISSLTSSYGARSLAASENICQKLNLEELPAVSVAEAAEILSSIRGHEQAEKHCDVQESSHEDHYDVDITMDKTIGHRYTFTIRLHMQKDADKSRTYYKSYDACCSAHSFAWYIQGFSFATDNATGDNKFESPSYLYFKVLGEGVEYIQVPVSVKGTYSPESNEAEFTYTL